MQQVLDESVSATTTGQSSRRIMTRAVTLQVLDASGASDAPGVSAHLAPLPGAGGRQGRRRSIDASDMGALPSIELGTPIVLTATPPLHDVQASGD